MDKLVVLCLLIIPLLNLVLADYIWHRDEIPYDPGAKCYRGSSYYTNNENARWTDVDLSSSVESLLAYPNDSICYYCVCSTAGDRAMCIPRDRYFCDYYRFLSEDVDSIRDVYTQHWGKDMPTLFRSLSQRLRRTMDQGLFDLIEQANDGKANEPEGDCVPYVSEYSDCTDATQCTGCTKCTCSSEGLWACNKVTECPKHGDPMDARDLDSAFDALLYEFKHNRVEPPTFITTKRKQHPEDVLDNDEELDLKIVKLLDRRKRSIKKSKKESRKRSLENKQSNNTEYNVNNRTIKFHNTIDELNEDILKNSTASGTIEAQKVDLNNLRRFDSTAKDNGTFDSGLQIEYNIPQNKGETVNSSELSITEQEKLGFITNQTQREKDSELSKIVVNELKKGSEFIGNNNAPVISNITFTPENDTLTAMALIAGNLLNKLWSMEKESGAESQEVEAMKTEKLQDLLELFKEPLTMRQEAFLKNALESLSEAIEQHKNGKNITVCANIAEAEQIINDPQIMDMEPSEIPVTFAVNSTEKPNLNNSRTKDGTTAKAISKLSKIMALVRKYRQINRRLNALRTGNHFDTDSPKRDEEYNNDPSLNMFGSILNRVTKLLLPYKNFKKHTNKMKSLSILANKDDKVKEKIIESFGIDLRNTSLTMKDKLIIDYLVKIKNSPHCLFDNGDFGDTVISNLGGEILQNLSEFLKIKSFVDLVTLLDDNQQPLHNNTTKNILRQQPEQTKNSQQVTTTENPKPFESTKEKLKAHLKSILDDVMELQKEKGLKTKDGEFSIADVLPCISNIINSKKDTNEYTDSTTQSPNYRYLRIQKVFGEIKQELKDSHIIGESRRINDDKLKELIKNAPPSAAVWERVVKNIDRQFKKTARRNAIKIPITFEQIKNKMDKIENISSSDAFKLRVSQVPLADRLMLLKALQAEIARGFNTLSDIKSSLEVIEAMPIHSQTDVLEFIDNFANKINLNKKVVEEMSRTDAAIVAATRNEQLYNNYKIQSTPFKFEEPKEDIKAESSLKGVKVTRADILNQLMRNRVSSFMTIATRDDPNYNIAKNILISLEKGNHDLAKQLYKIFVTSKQKTADNVVNDKRILSEKRSNVLQNDYAVPPSTSPAPSNYFNALRGQSIFSKEPLINFDEPSLFQNQPGQESLLRKFLLLKNLKAIS